MAEFAKPETPTGGGSDPRWWRWLRRGLLAVLACYAAGALVTQILLLPDFRHDPGFVRGLGARAAWPWLIGAALALWLLGLEAWRRWRTTALIDAALLDRLGPLCAGLMALSLAPFFSAYAAHAMLPVAAAGLALLLGASAAPLEIWIARLRALLGHRAAPWLAAALAAAWYFTISYYRHVSFGSGSRDMGLFFQSVWLLSQGQAPLNTLIDIPSANHAVNAFADHMEWIDLLMVPLVWLWRDAGALLLGQALLTGSGVAAVMRIAQRRSGDGLAALLLGGSYFLALPIAQAVQFDWNPTTLAVGLLVWAFDFADRRRYVGMLAMLLLVGLCKENLLLYVAAFGVYLAVERHDLRLAAALSGTALLAFVVELKLIVPIFRPEGFRHFYFKQLGGSFSELAFNTLRGPLRAASLLVTPGNKVDGLLLPFSATAWLGLLAPAPLIVAVPAIAERFLSDFRNAWWGHHYGGPTAAIAVIAAVHAVGLWAPRLQQLLAPRLPGLRASSLLGGLVLLATLASNSLGRWQPSDLFRLEKPYLPAVEERVAMRHAVAAVPEGVAVAAQNYLVAHLAARTQIYELREHRRAEVVALALASSPWPYDRRYVEGLARQLARDPQWQLIFCERQAWVFQRGGEVDAEPACNALDRLLGPP